jgi:hypothetical protein
MAQDRYLFVVSTLGLGMALAMVADGVWGHSPPIVEKTPAPDSDPTVAPPPLLPAPPPPPPSSSPSAQEGYVEAYLEEREKAREKEEKRLLKKINEDAYTGDDSPASRRLYLIQQAYKASRELTPIVPAPSDLGGSDSETGEDEDELVRVALELDSKKKRKGKT